MRDPVRHLKALAFAVTVFLVTSFALAQVYPQLFPFMPYVWPYVTDGSLTYAGTELKNAPAPPFALRDQRGATISLADRQGSVVLLTFLDPLCTDECGLMAQEIAAAQERLGADARELVVLAININPGRADPGCDARLSAKPGSWRESGLALSRWRVGSGSGD